MGLGVELELLFDVALATAVAEADLALDAGAGATAAAPLISLFASVVELFNADMDAPVCFLFDITMYRWG